MKRLKRFPLWRALLILGLLAGTAAPLMAATLYDVSGVTFSQTVTADQFVRVTEDLTVSWTAPTGTDPIFNYFLKINTSNAPLTGTALDDATYDFKTTSAELFRIIPVATFAAYDSNQLRYLHIRTQYRDSGTGNVAYSDDVVSAAIRIDNVAPTGTLTLDPTSGSTTQINVSMTPSESIRYYWLNDSSTFPGGAGMDYSLFPQGAVSLRDGTAYGNVTISAWFEDLAGNRSTAASASAVYNYTAPVSIQYNASTVNVDATLGFTVDQTTLYNWTITDASVSGVAEFSGASTGVASATVVGKIAGTFTVTATPSAGGTALKSGTITVVQTSTTKQYSLMTGLNFISLSRNGTGWAKAADLITAAGTPCQSVTKWDASTQKYITYNKALPIPSLNFDLVAGDGYFVNVNSGPMIFSVTGATITRTFSLVNGLNLIGLPESKSSITKAADLITAVGTSCQSVTKWDAATQKYVTYNKALPIPSLNFDVAVGEGYFLNVNAATDWQ